MLPTLQLGPLALPMGPLVVLIGVWLGVSWVEREAARLTLDRDRLSTLALIGLIAGVVGGRLAYAVQHFEAYAADPLGLISNNLATFAIVEGIVSGVLAATLYGRIHKLPLRRTLDALAPLLIALSGSIALAQLASGDGFGTPTDLPWSIRLWDADRHPTQIYALIGALGVGVIWWRWARALPDGLGFLIVVAGTAAATVVVEAFRGDSALWAGGWRSAQVIGLVALTISLIGMRRWGEPTVSVNSDDHGSSAKE